MLACNINFSRTICALYLKWWGMPWRTNSLTNSFRFFQWWSQSFTMWPQRVHVFSSPSVGSWRRDAASPFPPLPPDATDTWDVSEPFLLWLLWREFSDFASDSISLELIKLWINYLFFPHHQHINALIYFTQICILFTICCVIYSQFFSKIIMYFVLSTCHGNFCKRNLP